MTNEEREKLRSKYGITAEDEAPYVLPTEEDYQVLSKCKELETKNLSAGDKELVSFIRSQLFDDWRTPILDKLSKLSEKYK